MSEYKILFINPSKNQIDKHGRFTCVYCRELKIKVDGMICTYRNSISWKKDNCACQLHLEFAIAKVKREINSNSQDYTEADYQTWLRV